MAGVSDYRQRPDGEWIVGLGGGGNQLRSYLATDLQRKNSWGDGWSTNPAR